MTNKELIRTIGHLNLVLAEASLWEDEAEVLEKARIVLQRVLARV